MAMLTDDHIAPMLTNVNIHSMPKPINSAALGALVREAREAAGLTQTQLAQRIGASRFWVTAFEKGKPTAELGLALKAIHAVGLSLHIGPDHDAPNEQPDPGKGIPLANRTGHATLANIITNATLTRTAPTTVVGWPTAHGNVPGNVPATRGP